MPSTGHIITNAVALARVIFSIYRCGKLQFWNEPLDKRVDGDKNDQNDVSAKEPLRVPNYALIDFYLYKLYM